MRKLLIIEDEPLMCRLALQVIKRTPISVAIATNGEMGVRVAKSFHPDIALVDLNLPIISGTQVIQELGELEIPCIAWSSSRLRGDINAAYAAGAINYLFKGLPDELISTLEYFAKLLEQDNWFLLLTTLPSSHEQHYPQNFINRG